MRGRLILERGTAFFADLSASAVELASLQEVDLHNIK
jgi:hypothetical protein